MSNMTLKKQGQGGLIKIAAAAIVIAAATAAFAQNEWLDPAWRTANYPASEWYTGFAEHTFGEHEARVGTIVSETLRRVEREAQNRLVEGIAVRVTSESRHHTSSARRQVGANAARETVDRSYGQLIEASATAEVVNALTFSHHDAETRTISAFTAVRRTDLADFYASQIEVGLSEADRLLELFAQLIEMSRRIEALERLAEARTRVEALDFYRDLLVTVDPQNGLERSQGERVNDLLGRIAAAQNAHEQPHLVIALTGANLTEAQQRIVKARFIAPFTASNMYRAVDRSDIFLARPIVARTRRASGALILDTAYAVAANAGAQYLCVVDLVATEAGGFHVSARMIDAASGSVFGAMGVADIRDLDGIDRAAMLIFRQIHANMSTMAGEILTDPRDGRVYRTVTIGDQVWMAENIAFESPNSWCYNNEEINCQLYGRLYTFESASGACPGGWRLPRQRDWNELVTHAGGWRVAGRRLKSETDWNGTDEFGFAAVPSGGRACGGAGFALLGETAYWWTSTTIDRDHAFGRGMESGESFIGEGRNRRSCGFSVRCVRE